MSVSHERPLRDPAVERLVVCACSVLDGCAGGRRNLCLATHCAPAWHAALGCAVSRARHLEYFHDHVRIENLLFEGVLQPWEGRLSPDRSRAGFGLQLRRREAQPYLLASSEQRRER